VIGGIQLGPPVAAAGGVVPSPGAASAGPGAGDVAASGEFAAWLMAGLGAAAVPGHGRPARSADTDLDAEQASGDEDDDASGPDVVTGIAVTLPFVVAAPAAPPPGTGTEAPTIAPAPSQPTHAESPSAAVVVPPGAAPSMGASHGGPVPTRDDGGDPAASEPAAPDTMTTQPGAIARRPADGPDTDAVPTVPPPVPAAAGTATVPHRGPVAAARPSTPASGVTPATPRTASAPPPHDAGAPAPAIAPRASNAGVVGTATDPMASPALPATPAVVVPPVRSTLVSAPAAAPAQPAVPPARRPRDRGESVDSTPAVVPAPPAVAPASSAAAAVAAAGQLTGSDAPVVPTAPLGATIPSPRLRRSAFTAPAAAPPADASSPAAVPAAERGAAATAAVQQVLAATAPTAPALTPARRHLGETLAPAVLAATPAATPRDLATASPAVESPVAPSGVPLDDVLPTQIIRSIRLQWQAGSGEARVQLRPEYLGEMSVAVKVEQGAVTATLHAEASEVRRWLEAHSGSLRDALAEQGLRLDRLAVAEERPRHDASADRRQRQDDATGDDPARRRRSRPQDGEPRFDLHDSDSHERTNA
jgi:hypothetical protein